MNIVFNNYFPFKGFKAICLWPWVFVRNDVGRFDELPCLNHEMIHAAQQVELHIVGIVLTLFFLLTGYGWWSLLAAPLFFWWYGIEWAVRLAICRDCKAAYRGVLLGLSVGWARLLLWHLPGSAYFLFAEVSLAGYLCVGHLLSYSFHHIDFLIGCLDMFGKSKQLQRQWLP